MTGNTRGRTVPVMLIGVLLGMIMLTPVSAHHAPQHTKKQIKKVRKRAETTFFRRSGPFTVAFEDFTFAEVACPAGTAAIGGGASVDGPSGIGISTPTDATGQFVATEGSAGTGNRGWGVVVFDPFSQGPHEFFVYVTCQFTKTVNSNYPAGGPTYPRAPGRGSGGFSFGS